MSLKNTHGICSNVHPEMGKDYSQATQAKVMMKGEVKLLCFAGLWGVLNIIITEGRKEVQEEKRNK